MPEAALRMMAARLDQSMPVGNEGAGTVIRTGASDAAKALIDQGADIIMQHTDSPAAMQIASERGKLAFGQDSEMIKFGPKTQLTSILDTWGPYYIERVKAELAGTWKSEDSWGGLDSHMFAMAPYTNMPDDVKKIAEDAQAAEQFEDALPAAGGGGVAPHGHGGQLGAGGGQRLFEHVKRARPARAHDEVRRELRPRDLQHS